MAIAARAWSVSAGAALILLALAGSHAVAAGEGKLLRFGLSASPVTLDPRFATDAASTRINRLLYSQLVDFNDQFEAVPALARWQAIDSRRYRFTLNPDRRTFHDGSRVTASDVKATYDYVLDEANGSPHRGGLLTISAVEVLDPDTVDFVLNKPDALFPGRLVIGVLPAKLIEGGHPFNQAPAGSGPFEFLEWPIEDRLLIRRRRDGLTMEFVRVPKPTVRVLKLVRGELDMIQGDLPYELVGWLKKREEVVVESARGTTFAYIGFNMEDPVTSRLEVRRAVALAIDRQAIIRYVLGAGARPASAILTPDHWAGNPDLPLLERDREEAKKLLRKAGFAGGGPRLVYKTSNDPFRVRLATIIQDQLAKVGIDVELRTYDWGTFYGDVKAGNFQMYSLAWVGIKMPDIFRYVFHSGSIPPAGANRGRFVNAAADELIERAEASENLDEQAYYYRELQALVLDELPYVPLWYEDQVFAARRGIRGYDVAADGSYDGLTTIENGRAE
ncbi:MAG: ABC transporter substrate-binding protein [Gammaproteobacteria bacterium]|nr:ABC transporter substrate-binding protein [Gammaproteobacteria bacterium]